MSIAGRSRVRLKAVRARLAKDERVERDGERRRDAMPAPMEPETRMEAEFAFSRAMVGVRPVGGGK